MTPFEKFADQKNISITVLRSWRQRHGLPVIQIGRRLYIDNLDFEKWLEDHKQVFNKPVNKLAVVALPKKCRTSRIADKMQRIY